MMPGEGAGRTARTVTTSTGHTVHLREAVPDDAPQLIRAVDSVAREGAFFLRSRFEVDEEVERSFLEAAQQRGDLVLVAKSEGRIAGWVTLLRGKAEFQQHIAELGTGVVRDWRGCGVGSALMECALDWAAERGIEKVKLGVRAENNRAYALYLRFGFEEEGYRVRDVKDPDGGYFDIVEMAWFAPRTGDPDDA